MFGFVTANLNELTRQQKDRYTAVYCGICRNIRAGSSNLCRCCLSYDMALLALVLMSLYEPEETVGNRACALHPIRPRPWTENEFTRYAADMNVALAYFKALDDWEDDRKLTAKAQTRVFGKHLDAIRQRYPRQCDAISTCIQQLTALEKTNCQNPDEPANCFGMLMAELLVYEEDLWADTLRKMGMALGRFIYLADAAVDFRRDRKKGRYNPLLSVSDQEDWPRWEEYLILAMGSCTEAFERLPLVQDKKLLDNILYSGVWCNFGTRKKQEGEEGK